jgi:purine nucleoside phosphorylase
MLETRAGIELADSLSIDYIDRALGNLVGDSLFPEVRLSNEVNLRALVGLALKVKTRNY